MIQTQHDAHVRDARAVRTIFFCELAPGKSIELKASYIVPNEKVLWAALRLCEQQRMDLDGTWLDDFKRLEDNLESRLKKAELSRT